MSDYSWLQNEVTTAAWCWKVTRTDGTALCFTSHDNNITFSTANSTVYDITGTYKANTGFSPTATETSNDLTVDNLEVDGILNSNELSAVDLANGKYDNAEILVFVCDWSDLTNDILLVRRGTLGEVTSGKHGFKVDVRGLMQAYQQTVGGYYQKHCRVALGSTKCGYDVDSLQVTGTVTAVGTDGTITAGIAAVDDYFAYGSVTFTSGLNEGLTYEIKTFTDYVFTPFLPWIYTVAVGDTFTALPGCNGNLSTCVNIFDNVLNFRGEPYIPGNDYMTSYVTTDNTDTGDTAYVNTDDDITLKTVTGKITAIDKLSNTITTDITDIDGTYDGGTLEFLDVDDTLWLITNFTYTSSGGKFILTNSSAILKAVVGKSVEVIQRS